MSPIAMLGIACSAFVGSHLLLSHPLRGPLSEAMGVGAFRIFYSLVALATFGWVIWAFGRVPDTIPAYVAGDVAWGSATAAMWLACVLLAGSFFGNPALPSPHANATAMRNPLGVFAITRHPMMWSFAIWGIVHGALWPTPENHVLSAAIAALALIGSIGQDAKKARTMGDAWRGWCRRTAYFPFAGQISGRIEWSAAWPGWVVLIMGTGLWAGLSWVHTVAGSRVAAGIWRWAM